MGKKEAAAKVKMLFGSSWRVEKWPYGVKPYRVMRPLVMNKRVEMHDTAGRGDSWDEAVTDAVVSVQGGQKGGQSHENGI